MALSGQGCSEHKATPDGGGGDIDSGADDAGTDASGHSTEDQIGVFSVQLVAPRPVTPLAPARSGSTAIVGTVGDKPKPEQVIWTADHTIGDCTLFKPRIPFCDPSCGRNICVDDDTCTPDRALQDVGTVTIDGVMTSAGASSLTLTSVRNTYQNGAIDLPYPAFEAGDPITLHASGAGDFAPFELSAVGIATLQMPDDDVPVVEDTPVELTWTPSDASDGSDARILIALDISHHGGSKGKVECDVPDTGAATIDATLINELLALGVAGFPSVVLTRYSTSSTQVGGGRVGLRVYEYVERWVAIDGLVSCASVDGCPDGQTCRDDKTCG